jgi:single-strand DNA-binding protein
MAKDLNKVMLIGRLGADPEMRVISTGSTVVNFNIATGESYKDKNGNMVDKTEWHRIVVWDKLAEICKQYLRKGSKIYIEGKLQTRSWDDKETGKKNYATEIVCTDMMMLDGKGSNTDGGGGMSEPPTMREAYDSSKESSASSAPKATAPKAKPAAAVTTEETKDDLPF